MKVMITGAAGFIGGYLAAHFLQAGDALLGIDIREPQNHQNLWHAAAFEGCDVRDSTRLTHLLSAFRPEQIFHLAGQSSPRLSLLRPRETMDVNAGGTVALFEALRVSAIRPTVVVACSSAEYGPVDDRDLPVRETHALAPLHPYGVSKVAQDLLAAQYFANYDMPAIRIRVFNTTGPGAMGEVCSDLTKRAVEIEMKTRSSMAAGNLHSRRSLVDVRDLVRGLALSADQCVPGEVYNLGGDHLYSVADVLETIATLSGKRFQVEQQADLLRRCDEPAVHGDNSKFRSRCEWKPGIPLQTTLRDMLEWWRRRLALEPETETATPEAAARR